MRISQCLIFGSLLASTPAFAQDNFISYSFGAPTNQGPPDVYVIQRGDTLWDISTKFLGNPYYWPRLWSINDYITNPHWIYPGNRIVFRPGTLLDPPGIGIDGGGGYAVASLDFASGELECGPDIIFDEPYTASVYTTPGFLSSNEDLEVYGEVFASKMGMIKLAEGDRVYMELDNANAVECGDVLAVYRKRDKVRHPEHWFQKFGNMYDVLAEVTVVHTDGEVATGVVRTSYQPFNRGDIVGPLVPVRTEVPVDVPRGDLEGTIVALLNDKITMAYTGETLFLDLGRDDGVKVGSTFYVVRRNDPIRERNFYGWDDEVPLQVVGRVVVTQVDDAHSTAVVVDAALPIRDGDRISMKVE